MSQNVADFQEILVPFYKWIYKTLMKTSYAPDLQKSLNHFYHTQKKVLRQSSRICCMNIIRTTTKKLFKKLFIIEGHRNSVKNKTFAITQNLLEQEKNFSWSLKKKKKAFNDLNDS